MNLNWLSNERKSRKFDHISELNENVLLTGSVLYAFVCLFACIYLLDVVIDFKLMCYISLFLSACLKLMYSCNVENNTLNKKIFLTYNDFKVS